MRHAGRSMVDEYQVVFDEIGFVDVSTWLRVGRRDGLYEVDSEVMPFEEANVVADDHDELHVAKAKRMPRAERG